MAQLKEKNIPRNISAIIDIVNVIQNNMEVKSVKTETLYICYIGLFCFTLEDINTLPNILLDNKN